MLFKRKQYKMQHLDLENLETYINSVIKEDNAADPKRKLHYSMVQALCQVNPVHDITISCKNGLCWPVPNAFPVNNSSRRLSYNCQMKFMTGHQHIIHFQIEMDFDSTLGRNLASMMRGCIWDASSKRNVVNWFDATFTDEEDIYSSDWDGKYLAGFIFSTCHAHLIQFEDHMVAVIAWDKLASGEYRQKKSSCGITIYNCQYKDYYMLFKISNHLNGLFPSYRIPKLFQMKPSCRGRRVRWDTYPFGSISEHGYEDDGLIPFILEEDEKWRNNLFYCSKKIKSMIMRKAKGKSMIMRKVEAVMECLIQKRGFETCIVETICEMAFAEGRRCARVDAYGVHVRLVKIFEIS